MSDLARAIVIAAKAHARQRDKADDPYIFHVLRVVEACPAGDAKIIAALHDVVEDTDWTIADLQEEGFSLAVVSAVASVTRGENETYGAFIARAAMHPLGRIVKLADVRDHMTRSYSLKESLRVRYERAAAALAPERFAAPSVASGPPQETLNDFAPSRDQERPTP